MQSENKMFDDFVKMVNGFAGTFAGMGREAETSAREKFKPMRVKAAPDSLSLVIRSPGA